MKEIIKNSLFTAILMTCGVVYSSCDDWTEPESVTLHSPSIEEQNPQLYADYLKNVRLYKQSEHKFMIAKFDNKQTAPTGQGERLSALPDSIDYVILNNPDNLGETIVSEMAEIREKKGTKTLFSIDYTAIEEEYLTKQEGTAEGVTEGAEGTKEPETDGFPEFCSQRVEECLALFNKYTYDGINVVYNGISPQTLSGTEREKLKARQDAFFEKVSNWKASHADAVMLFEGTPHNLLSDKSILLQAQFITIPAADVTSRNQLLSAVEASLTEEVPSDRILFGIRTINPEDASEGYFTDLTANGTPMTAIIGAAYSAIASKGNFTKAGLCVESAQNDYYNTPKNYKNIREAIAIMNPSF